MIAMQTNHHTYQSTFRKTLLFISALLLIWQATSSAQQEKNTQKKQWTFIVYMSAVNDLRGFAATNIKQMAQIGSNEHINIVIHLDILLSGNRKITRRYYVENNRVLQINANDPETQQMDSGDPKTLISCCQWAIHNYPAEHYCLVFWNHGSGIRDIVSRRDINTNELFVFNAATNKLDLDRSIGFIDYISQCENRGVCWDDITGNYLSNQKIDSALKEICSTCLDGNKFDIIAFDACLMMMVEIADLVEPYTKLLAGSQEVELGTGWNYNDVLSPFAYNSLTPTEFAQHMVAMYQKTYNNITDDFTQSAVDLKYLPELRDAIDEISHLLLECLKKQRDKSVKKAIKASRNKKITTAFDEPTYIDLHHWYTNLQASLKYFNLAVSQHEEALLKDTLNRALEYGKQLISYSVIANTTGKNLNKAKGLSIYFPEKNIDPSYKLTYFMKRNSWGQFLMHYLSN